MNRMRAALGLFAAARTEGLVSPDYAIFHPVCDVNLDYAVQLFRTPAMASVFRLESRGLGTGESGFLRLYSDRFGTIPIPFPPPDEQAAIVRFLAWSTGQVDRAILAMRKVIALLNEQKHAVINRTVLRGLAPSIRLKSSGIEWLGNIPQHWHIRQLRHMGRLHKGVGGSKEDATSSGVPCVRYGELYFHYKNFIRQPRGFVPAEISTKYAPIQFGDVLFAASGERVEEIGKSAVNLYEGEAVCGGDIVIFRPTVAVHAPFLGYALDSSAAAHQKSTMCRGTTIKHVYPDELRSLWACVPPISEQEEIVAALDRQLLGCNTTISRLEREIELLTRVPQPPRR